MQILKLKAVELDIFSANRTITMDWSLKPIKEIFIMVGESNDKDL
jgi:hypothetical protein